MEESGYTKAWEHKGVCFPPETDGSFVFLVQGHKREEAGKGSWGQRGDALVSPYEFHSFDKLQAY